MVDNLNILFTYIIYYHIYFILMQCKLLFGNLIIITIRNEKTSERIALSRCRYLNILSQCIHIQLRKVTVYDNF